MLDFEIPQNFTLIPDIPCITLILSKIGKSLLNFPLSILVIRLDSLCDSLGARTQDPILKRDVLYLLS